VIEVDDTQIRIKGSKDVLGWFRRERTMYRRVRNVTEEAVKARLIGLTFHDATLLPWKTDQPTQRAARSSSDKATLRVVDPSVMLDHGDGTTLCW
jgi:hypothetical protein